MTRSRILLACVAALSCAPDSSIVVGGADGGRTDAGSAGGGTSATGGGSAAFGGGTTTGGGSAATGGGRAQGGGTGVFGVGGGSVAGGGTAATGGGTAIGGGSANGGGSAAGGGATTGGGSTTGGGTATGGGAATVTVQASVTADNAYSFGYGNIFGINTFIQGSRAGSAGDIFNCGTGPEAYTVPNILGSDYLYIISWDDLSVTQGVIGQFRSAGSTLYTGDPGWEVCATGLDFSNSAVGPTQAQINLEIDRCNQGLGSTATTSSGWVDVAGAVTPGAVGTLAVGEANQTVYTTVQGSFPGVCDSTSSPQFAPATIDLAAHWMWYQPGGIANPFSSNGSNQFKAYLIFRLRAGKIEG